MAVRLEEYALSANEAACVTGVPLKQVHRIIDAGLLGDAVESRKGARVILSKALVGLKFAYESTEMLTLEGRRRLVRHLLDDPEAKTVREDAVSVDVRAIMNDVQRGLTTLEKAKKMIGIDKDVLAGAPCFKGTRIPVHDIAEMVAHGDDIHAILAGYPALTEGQIDASSVYAEAYPRRGRPRQEPAWRKKEPLSSREVALDKLPRAS
jgi:uncharacterized protein (DUF433 family)